MTKRQVFFDSIKRDSTGRIEPYASGASMYHEGNSIIYYACDFDGEDRRRYDYAGEFSVEEYRKAIEMLQRTGSCVLNGSNYNLRMAAKGNEVELAFFGTPSPSSTPGGASLSGVVKSKCRLEDLILKDN